VNSCDSVCVSLCDLVCDINFCNKIRVEICYVQALQKADTAKKAASSASSSVTGALSTVDNILFQLGMSVRFSNDGSGLVSLRCSLDLFDQCKH